MSNTRPSEIKTLDVNEINQLIFEGTDLMSFDIKHAQKNAEKAYSESLALKYLFGMSSSLILLGSCSSIEGDSVSAIQNIQKGLDLASDSGLPDVLAKGFLALGNVYYRCGDLEEALVTYLKGLEQTRFGSGEQEMSLLNNISVIYSKTNQFDQALKFLQETLGLAEKNTEFYGFILANVAEVYFKMDNMPEAEKALLSAEKILLKLALNKQYLIQFYKIKGKLASYQKQEPLALSSFLVAMQFCEQLGDTFRKCSIGLEMGRHYMTTEQYDLAIETFKKARVLGESISADVELRDMTMLMAKCFERQHDYENAFKEMKRYQNLFEKINTKALANQLLIKTALFEVEQAKKDAEIQRLRNEEVHLIGKIGQIITATLDFKTVLRLIYKHIQSIVEVDAFGVCTVNTHHNTIEFKMMIEDGKKQPLHHVRIDDSGSLAAKCIRERQLLHFQDLSQSNVKNKSIGTSMKSVIYFPLIVSDEVIGALTLQCQRANAYSDNALRLVDSLGAYIGIALKNSMQADDLAKKKEALELLSQTDVLTNLYNRRFMMTRLDAEWDHYQRTQEPFFIAMLDVDHFKHTNDVYGHHVGDAILVKIGHLMKKKLRKYDVVGRWGGEEFLILIPENDEGNASLVCERLRQSIEKMRLVHDHKRVSVTITIGLTMVSSDDESIDGVIQRADKAMYKGKKMGRNCLVIEK